MSLIKKVKAYAQGRKGPRLLQSYFDLRKLMQKEVVYSPNSSGIMRITPYLNMGVLLVVTLFVPIVFIPDAPAGIGNIIVFLYLLAVERFLRHSAGLMQAALSGAWGVPA